VPRVEVPGILGDLGVLRIDLGALAGLRRRVAGDAAVIYDGRLLDELDDVQAVRGA
jgi:hypothetical protein